MPASAILGPDGLALPPTQAFERLENYAWQGKSLHFEYGPSERALALEIDGVRVEGTLQVPEASLRDGSRIRLVPASAGVLWLRSTVRLDRIANEGESRSFHCAAHGLSRITFSASLEEFTLHDAEGRTITCQTHAADGLFHIDFNHWGDFQLSCKR